MGVVSDVGVVGRVTVGCFSERVVFGTALIGGLLEDVITPQHNLLPQGEGIWG